MSDCDDLNAYLDEVLVGGREQRPVVIVDYDPAWPERFEQERAHIRAALAQAAIRIEHVGSTSVPGLAAKPIVDIMVTVADADDEPAFAPALGAAGYVLRVREPGHRMFRTPEVNIQVHVWADGDPEVDRCLAFRDWLRAAPANRDAYERLKRELATQSWSDVNHYAVAKGPFIEDALAQAGVKKRDYEPERVGIA